MFKEREIIDKKILDILNFIYPEKKKRSPTENIVFVVMCKYLTLVSLYFYLYKK